MQSLNYRIATHQPGDVVKVHVESGKAARESASPWRCRRKIRRATPRPLSGRNPLGGAKVENLSPAAAVDLQMDLLAKGVVITVSRPATVSPRNRAFSPATSCAASMAPAIDRVERSLRAP